MPGIAVHPEPPPDTGPPDGRTFFGDRSEPAATADGRTYFDPAAEAAAAAPPEGRGWRAPDPTIAAYLGRDYEAVEAIARDKALKCWAEMCGLAAFLPAREVATLGRICSDELHSRIGRLEDRISELTTADEPAGALTLSGFSELGQAVAAEQSAQIAETVMIATLGLAEADRARPFDDLRDPEGWAEGLARPHDSALLARRWRIAEELRQALNRCLSADLAAGGSGQLTPLMVQRALNRLAPVVPQDGGLNELREAAALLSQHWTRGDELADALGRPAPKWAQQSTGPQAVS